MAASRFGPEDPTLEDPVAGQIEIDLFQKLLENGARAEASMAQEHGK